MQCVASYEIRTEGSVFEDGRVLRIRHPKGTYRARIRNIPRTTFATPFLLSLHLYFDAPSLNEAKDVADGHLVDCMNMLAFATGCEFWRHRIRLLADATPKDATSKDGMRAMHLWSDTLQYQDPKPLLFEDVTRTIETLMQFDVPPAIRRAMRWFRLGVNATAADDQFMNFWFALEIVAEYQKSTEKVPDRCAVCQTPLYCETCKTHTTHKPYAKQAIRALLKQADPKCNDATVDRLDLARNRLMHGSTLEEIDEAVDPDDSPNEHVVNLLGRLVWKALIFQFPPEIINGKLRVLIPSTYLHFTMEGVMHMSTVVHADPDGDLDLDAVLRNTKAEMVPFAPPQSGRPTRIVMTADQHERLKKFAWSKESESQIICRRVFDTTETQDGKSYAIIFSTDMAGMREAIDRDDKQEWVSLFREILGASKNG